MRKQLDSPLRIKRLRDSDLNSMYVERPKYYEWPTWHVNNNPDEEEEDDE